jgi:hypothetical protein
MHLRVRFGFKRSGKVCLRSADFLVSPEYDPPEFAGVLFLALNSIGVATHLGHGHKIARPRQAC